MQIYISDVSGFCFGVKRAYEKCQKYFDRDFQTLGPLIHNPEILKKIKENKGEIAEDIENIKSDNVIIRAHGISKTKLKKLEKKAKNIEDTTCPFVHRLQNAAKKYHHQNYQIIIIGKASHPEIKSITEDIKDALVIFSAQEANNLGNFEKIAVLSQTTERIEKVDEIIEILKRKAKELKSENTICTDVKKRQTAAKKLSEKVDMILILGGKESSNTKKLYEICKQNCPAYLIEDEYDIDLKIFENIEKVGICSGSSTPIELTERVKNFILKNTA